MDVWALGLRDGGSERVIESSTRGISTVLMQRNKVTWGATLSRAKHHLRNPATNLKVARLADATVTPQAPLKYVLTGRLHGVAGGWTRGCG